MHECNLHGYSNFVAWKAHDINEKGYCPSAPVTGMCGMNEFVAGTQAATLVPVYWSLRILQCTIGTRFIWKLFWWMQVLLACMKSVAGALLSNRDVCTVVNTCFRVVHQAGSKGELLQRTARHTMHELVRAIFSHLSSLSPATSTAPFPSLPTTSSELLPSNGTIYVCLSFAHVHTHSR